MRFALILIACVGTFLLAASAEAQCRGGSCRTVRLAPKKAPAKLRPLQRVAPRYWRHN